MLGQVDDSPQLSELTESLPCRVIFPESWGDFFEQSGPLPSGPDDMRQCPRYYYRLTIAIQYRQTLPSLPRDPVWHKIYTRDLSRSGLSFLHFEQLYPGERLNVLLPGDTEASIEIVRCHRVQAHCYIISARFATEAAEKT